jgi:hypothetical protein
MAMLSQQRVASTAGQRAARGSRVVVQAIRAEKIKVGINGKLGRGGVL